MVTWRLADFEVEAILDTTAEGQVKAVRHMPSGAAYLLKSYVATDQAYNEAQILQKLSHASVPKLVTVIESDGQVLLLLEHIVGSTLCHFVGPRPGVDLPVARKLFASLMQAVHYLHMMNVVHRKISIHTVLVTASGVKLTEFSQATIPNRRPVGPSQSLWTKPPELLNHSKFSGLAADIWACGAVGAYLVTGATQAQAKPSAALPPIIARMLHPSPEQRPTAKEVLEDAWVSPNKSFVRYSDRLSGSYFPRLRLSLYKLID